MRSKIHSGVRNLVSLPIDLPAHLASRKCAEHSNSKVRKIEYPRRSEEESFAEAVAERLAGMSGRSENEAR